MRVELSVGISAVAWEGWNKLILKKTWASGADLEDLGSFEPCHRPGEWTI